MNKQEFINKFNLNKDIELGDWNEKGYNLFNELENKGYILPLSPMQITKTEMIESVRRLYDGNYEIADMKVYIVEDWAIAFWDNKVN